MADGRVVIITGASAGIGRAIAIAYAREGARVVLTARGASALQTLADELTKQGHQAIAVPSDVTLPATFQKVVDATLEAFGQIDVLVNNAGITVYGPFWEVEPERFDAVMETNFLGAVRCTRLVLPHMIRRRSGQIVNISSPAGKRGLPQVSAYCASKFALNGWSEALRVELRAYGVSVVLVLPDQTESELYSRAPSTVSAGPFKEFMLRARRDTADSVARLVLKASRRGRLEQFTRLRSRLLVRLNQLSPALTDWVIAQVLK